MNVQGGPTRATPPDADTARRLLDTAFRLFHEQGYHATGVATILRESGVNAGSLYHHFTGKDDLLLAVLRHAKTLLHPRVMARAEHAAEDPLERVFALMRVYREMMSTWSCRMGCPIGNLALEVADDNPQARQLIHENFENWTSFVRAWLGQAADRLPAETDLDQLARFVLTVMEGGIMQARAAGNLAPFDDGVAQLRAYFESLEEIARVRAARPKRRGKGAR